MKPLKDIIKLPEKKDISGMQRIFGPGSPDVCIGLGKNETIDEVGNKKYRINKKTIHRIFGSFGCTKSIEIVQRLEDNIGSLLEIDDG